jgi:hypothetical protein
LTTPGIALSARTTSLPVPGMRCSSLRSSTSAPGDDAGASPLTSIVSAFVPALSITTSSIFSPVTLASAASNPSRSTTSVAPIGAVIRNLPSRADVAVWLSPWPSLPSTCTRAPATTLPNASITRPVTETVGAGAGLSGGALGASAGLSGGSGGCCATTTPGPATRAARTTGTINESRNNMAVCPHALRSFSPAGLPHKSNDRAAARPSYLLI